MPGSSLDFHQLDGAPDLSRRAIETLHYLCQGSSEKQVAKALGLSRHTVHAYVKELHRKCGVNTRAELLSKVYQTLGEKPKPHRARGGAQSKTRLAASKPSLSQAEQALFLLTLSRLTEMLLWMSNNFDSLRDVCGEGDEKEE